jgi:hypothetical protein
LQNQHHHWDALTEGYPLDWWHKQTKSGVESKEGYSIDRVKVEICQGLNSWCRWLECPGNARKEKLFHPSLTAPGGMNVWDIHQQYGGI